MFAAARRVFSILFSRPLEGYGQDRINNMARLTTWTYISP